MADKFVSQSNLSLFSSLLKGKYAASFSISGRVITLYNADGTSIASVTVPETSIADVTTTGTASGLMTPAMAAKLAAITADADSVEYVSNGVLKINGTNTTVYAPSGKTQSSALVKVTTSNGLVTATASVTKADITALGIPSENTTYSAVSATGSVDGLMTPAQATKLAGISTGAEVNTITSVKVNGTALTVTGRSVNVDLSDYAKKSDLVDMKVLQYQGSVATYSALPSSPTAGDVYNIEAADDDNGIGAGSNVVWTGSEWDVLNPSLFSIQECTDAEIKALV